LAKTKTNLTRYVPTVEEWQERWDEELSRGISIKVRNNLKNRYDILGKIPEFTEAIRGWVAQMNEIDPTPGMTGNPRASASNLHNTQNMYKPDNIEKGEYEMYN
jgi:hypothetical protein